MIPDHDAIEEEIRRAIRKVKPSLTAFPLPADTPFANLGLASLERAIVVFEIEDAYEIELVSAGLDTSFSNIGEARDLVASLLSKKELTKGVA